MELPHMNMDGNGINQQTTNIKMEMRTEEEDCDVPNCENDKFMAEEDSDVSIGNEEFSPTLNNDDETSSEEYDGVSESLGQESEYNEEYENEVSNQTRDQHEGNLLSNVVTMHTTEQEPEYSPTLAMCDIFNKSKRSPSINAQQVMKKEKKEEFLIIDLDSGKEQAAKTKPALKCNNNNEIQKNIDRPKNLVSVTLSSKDDATNNNFLCPKQADNQNKNDFLQFSKSFDNQPRENICLERDNFDRGIATNRNECLDTNSRNETCIPRSQSKPIYSRSVPLEIDSCDGITTKEIYPTHVGFHSNDLNDFAFQSHEPPENDPYFCIPETYSTQNEEDRNSYQYNSSFPKIPNSHSSNLETNNCSVNEDTTVYDQSFLSNTNHYQNYSQTPPDFYEPFQIPAQSKYNFEERIYNNLINGIENNDLSVTLARHQENKKNYVKNKIREVCGGTPIYPPPYPMSLSRNSFLNSSPPIPVTSIQQQLNNKPQILSSTPSNYSSWSTLWSNNPSHLFEVNLNNFASAQFDTHNAPLKNEWANDASMNNFYHDQDLSLKSNQAEFDSEATEDADEIDDVPIFFDDNNDPSACDNLSTMSVTSGYSENSSSMNTSSPSPFTPPPSNQNTVPLSSYHQNVLDNNRFSYQMMKEPSRPEPLHLFSPTMLSTPYRLDNDKIEPNLLTYEHGPGLKRYYYPSMADMHHSRSGLSTSTPLQKYEPDAMFDFTDNQMASRPHQIQSDKISTSSSRNVYQKSFTNTPNQSMECYADTDYIKRDTEMKEPRRLRHNEPLKQSAIQIMTRWYEQHIHNPYPTKDDKMKMAREGGITIVQVKSWFANKRNRTNNTKPKVQKRAMKEKLKKLFQDLKHSRSDNIDNTDIIQQLSGIIQT